MKNENSNYILTSDGRFISEDELYHALSIRSWKESKNHKYISREWGKSGWVYKYPSDSNTKSTSKTNAQTQTKTGTDLLNTLSSYFKSASSTMNKTASTKSTGVKNLVSTGLKALSNATSKPTANASKSNKSSDYSKSIANNILNKLGKTDISNVKVGSTPNKENASESKIGSLIEKGKTAFNDFIGITDKREAEAAQEQANLLKDATDAFKDKIDISQKDYNDARDNAYEDNDISERERRSIALYKKKLDSANEKYSDSLEKYSDALEKYEKENQEYLKTPLGAIENAVEKGKDFFNKLFVKRRTDEEGFEKLQKEWEEEAEQGRLQKEAEKEEAERQKKGEYAEAQTEERTTLRIPELYNLLKSLKKDNPLPDLPLKTKATTLDEDMAAINPNYNTNTKSNYDENCGACTIAYDLRRRGYDVAAVDEDAYLKGGNSYLDLLTCYDNVDLTNLITRVDIEKEYGVDLPNVYPPTREEVSYMEHDMLNEGEGARGNFMMQWINGGGHSISWEVEDGEVVYRDCQTNKKIDIEDYRRYAKSFTYFRTDNLTPNENVLDYIQNYVRN